MSNRSDPALKVEIKQLLEYINATPDLIDLLYDLDLMPEQLRKRSYDWQRMLILARWHQTQKKHEQTRG